MGRVSKGHPGLAFPPDYDPVLNDVRRRFFPSLWPQVALEVTGTGHLASIRHSAEPVVYAHAILLRPWVPAFVREFVYKHELLHLVVPSVDSHGRYEMHTDEYWQREQELCPERKAAWEWLHFALDDCLGQSRGTEGVIVKRNWKRVDALAGLSAAFEPAQRTLL